jgi:uncharacterized protein (TIGR02145 family)
MSYKGIIKLTLLFGVFFLLGCDDKEDVVKVKPEMGTVSDNEGNNYMTVKIGNQWWMAEDLKSTKFRNGTPISFINELEVEKWSQSNTAAYTKGNISNLYNFYTVNSPENIAPEGWHVATDKDWQILESHLGMSNEEVIDINWRGIGVGDKLKQDYQLKSWTNFSNIWGTNESGFAALPCSCRLFDGRLCFPNSKEQGFWWTATTIDNEAYFRNLDYKKSEIFRYATNPKYGFAIRCVKD